MTPGKYYVRLKPNSNVLDPRLTGMIVRCIAVKNQQQQCAFECELSYPASKALVLDECWEESTEEEFIAQRVAKM